MWFPEINGIKIESYDMLEEVIRRDASEFLLRSDAPRLLELAKLHLRLFCEYHDKEFIPRGTIARLSKETGTSPTTLKRWLLQGARPRMYYWLGMAPIHERKEKVDRILTGLNGATNTEEVRRRFSKLYSGEERVGASTHSKNHDYTEKFFLFLKEYLSGGIIKDIARKLKVGHTTASEWLRGSQLPTEVKFASLIPAETPSDDWKWLPLRLNSQLNIPEDFIQVPVEVSSPEDILDVLKQLESLTTPEMAEYESQFGDISDPIAFMYLLGLIIADGGFVSDTSWSSRVKLFASKKYNWSKTLGEAFCYAMGRIGISADRKSDSVRVRHGRTQVCRVWSSEASPLFMWMKKTMLGLDASTVKKENKIHADWILQMPREWRVSFIQGLADGDGYASFSTSTVAIATATNQILFNRILTSLEIRSSIESTKVRIRRHADIMRAKELPFFKHATGRQDRLNNLSKMIKLTKTKRGKLTTADFKLVLELSSKGYSPGQISETLWYEYGISRTTASIEGILRRRKEANSFV